MSLPEKCRKCSVKVGEGSGVLFQPMTEQYSYILTAKHNLYDDDNNDQAIYHYTQPKDLSDIEIKHIVNIMILNKFEHSSLDIAILKINKIDFDSPVRYIKHPVIRDKYLLYGYPSLRNDGNEEQNLSRDIMPFDITVIDIVDNYVVVQNSEDYDQNDIMGCSGGGVFTDVDDGFYLVGVENEMDSSSQEHNRRFRFIQIEKFDEIIEQNLSELVPLYPPYMNDFNHLIEDDIFLLPNLMMEKEKVTNILKDIATSQISNNITPKQIFDQYGTKLLTKNEYINELTNKCIWTAYLEFLVINHLVDSTSISLQHIDVIYKKRKFLFAKTANWTDLIKEIFLYDIKSLEAGGIVCIACDIDKTPTMSEIPTELVKRINVVPSPRMNVNQALENPVDNLKVQHIFNFQKKIIDNQIDLDGLNMTEIEGRICDAAKNIFE